MRILQIAPRVCWPLDTGAKLRNYHLARVLGTRAQVTLLAFAERDESTNQLDDVYARTVLVPRSQGYSFGKVVRGALGRTPLPLLNYTTEGMKQALARLIHETDFDVVQVESIHMMNYLPIIQTARNAPLTICDWHNIESELMQQYSARAKNVGRRAYARQTARLMKESEKRALAEFDAHIVVSQNDAERLRAINSDARIFVIANGVDAASFADTESRTRNRIVFVGSMDYHANIDGAIQFARNVWPTVRTRNPNLVFTIVGRNPTPAVRELSSIAGVEVTGSVDDVRPYYREAILAVVPLNVGAGSRLKILEAMAAGVPVVSTARGAEGLAVRHRENILLVDTITELAGAITEGIDNQELRRQLISRGRELVSSRYDWSKVGQMLFSHYRDFTRTSPAGANE